MERRSRKYSSDSVGSDAVFIEDSCYQGMLRAMDHRKDERDRVQKKTFTKWVNKHLMKAQRHITDLYEDLRDGHNLISLLEVLSGETLPREKGRMRFHKLQNVQIALDFLKHRQVKLVNIRNDDIADGNPKLTLGLIWTIILHFQISDIQVNGQSDDMTAKEKLLLWSQRMVEGYQGLRCDNFTTNWRDGKLFNAIIHKHSPEGSATPNNNNTYNLSWHPPVSSSDDVGVSHESQKRLPGGVFTGSSAGSNKTQVRSPLCTFSVGGGRAGRAQSERLQRLSNDQLEMKRSGSSQEPSSGGGME
ncbi:Plectin [Nibea albiflora]|uniref:Plectin n=1 Tax=Nibea albiflora TaxID=240163 RepID=A0ACB7ES05_NIBAL|nr:Plectin [Nibea albiflora]